MKNSTQKVQAYYDNFQEWERFNTDEGKLEFQLTLNIIFENISSKSTILDLGGGPGRYTIELSNQGHSVYLGDLSPELIKTAKEKTREFGNLKNIKNISVINALDLSKYEDDFFDTVILFGPLYHLYGEEDINKCLGEVYRVLKKGGKIIASYIPWLSGVEGILERSFHNPKQVDSKVLLNVYQAGAFHNKRSNGFQEGSYLKSQEIESYMHIGKFSKLLHRSIRGIGYKKAKELFKIKETSIEYYNTIINIIHKSASEESIIETCGHAIYIGKK